MSPAADAVIRRLDGARQRWWLFTLMTSAILASCASFFTLLLFMLSDAFLMFSQLTLVILFAVWLLVTAVLVFLVGRRLLRSQRSLEATARRVEYEFPELGSDLINLVQLTSDTRNENRAFCEAAVSDAVTKIGRFPVEEAAKRESRWGRFMNCMQTPRDLLESVALLGGLVAAAVMCHLFVPNWGSAGTRLLSPWNFVPSIGSVEIVKVTPGNTEVLVGSSLDIAAEIKNPEGKSYKGSVRIDVQGEVASILPMACDDKQVHFKASIATVMKPLTYRLQIGDSQTEIYTVGVREKPTVREMEAVYHYPAYLEKAAETVSLKTPDLEAPQYTVAELRIRPSCPIAKGHLQCGTQKYVGEVEDNGRLLVVKLPMLSEATYTILLFNDAGHTDPDPRPNRIRIRPDKAPSIMLLKPANQSVIAPGADIPVMIRAGDDHAVGRVRLEMKIEHPSGEENSSASAEAQPITPVNEWTKFEGTTTVLLNHRLELGKGKVSSGDVIRLRAVAWDKRAVVDWNLDLKPQETISQWYSVRVVAEEAKLSQTLEQNDNLRNQIWKILETQIRARVKATLVLKKKELQERTALSGEIRNEQIAVQKAAIGLVASIGKTDKEDRVTIKQAMNKLANDEMMEAVRHCDELQKLKAADAFTEPLPKLVAVQDKIIDVLRKLLDVSRKSQADALAETKKRPNGDLPPDVKDKYENLKNKLEEFVKAQKKVIEATENLAKKPVEDFTEKEEQALRGLAASQDEWAKLMKELHSDLSKLPEQDFANASMAKELVEIQTEIKMAEDALLKKSADIAVPLEQLGTEKAEEMVTNLEKWLPDEPDREKWSQEESLSDDMKEAPMAELPGELEDLIGELMEQEEDLFDEMEDVSSSMIDNLDKGAGWDAKDGPISDNSAKGVTGNNLPNTSEIGGRSGEGRSGKSSGEFVGDEAVGKGGRMTPSRLTPDPYVKGQINDHSKDPQGGATGGGKESGQGGEGLEGPAPRSPGSRDMERLAGKQAALRNKAEGVDVQFQVGGYHHTDLQKMLDVMANVERDLRSGRYQNALRQRQILTDGLGNIKQYIEGEFQVKQDHSTNLPANIQKEILGSMQEASPPGWEELNREYFGGLATGTTTAGGVGIGDGEGGNSGASSPKKE